MRSFVVRGERLTGDPRGSQEDQLLGAWDRRVSGKHSIPRISPKGLDHEHGLFAWEGEQADAREGIASFLEKREPKWSMRPSRDLPSKLAE